MLTPRGRSFHRSLAIEKWHVNDNVFQRVLNPIKILKS